MLYIWLTWLDRWLFLKSVVLKTQPLQQTLLSHMYLASASLGVNGFASSFLTVSFLVLLATLWVPGSFLFARVFTFGSSGAIFSFFSSTPETPETIVFSPLVSFFSVPSRFFWKLDRLDSAEWSGDTAPSTMVGVAAIDTSNGSVSLTSLAAPKSAGVPAQSFAEITNLKFMCVNWCV